MRIIITGATGFIGRALCDELNKRGCQVTALVRNESKNLDKLPGYIKTIKADLTDVDHISGEFDVFYHLAWNRPAGDDRDDYDLQSVNITLTGNALRLAKRTGCKRFIGAGSHAEYGCVKGLCNENTVTNPFMMYGAVKLATCKMGSILAKQLDLEFVWPRIYSVYGAGESDNTVLSYVIRSLMKGDSPELSSCENMWDFLYITDCARALAELGNLDKKLHGVYNVSYGEPKLLREFIDIAVKLIDPNINPHYGVRTNEEERTFWLEPDVSKLKAVPFIPEVTFEQGIRKKFDSMNDGS